MCNVESREYLDSLGLGVDKYVSINVRSSHLFRFLQTFQYHGIIVLHVSSLLCYQLRQPNLVGAPRDHLGLVAGYRFFQAFLTLAVDAASSPRCS